MVQRGKVIRDFRATRAQRLASDVRYLRFYAGDILAGLATAGILILAPILMALGR